MVLIFLLFFWTPLTHAIVFNHEIIRNTLTDFIIIDFKLDKDEYLLKDSLAFSVDSSHISVLAHSPIPQQEQYYDTSLQKYMTVFKKSGQLKIEVTYTKKPVTDVFVYVTYQTNTMYNPDQYLIQLTQAVHNNKTMQERLATLYPVISYNNYKSFSALPRSLSIPALYTKTLLEWMNKTFFICINKNLVPLCILTLVMLILAFFLRRKGKLYHFFLVCSIFLIPWCSLYAYTQCSIFCARLIIAVSFLMSGMVLITKIYSWYSLNIIKFLLLITSIFFIALAVYTLLDTWIINFYAPL